MDIYEFINDIKAKYNLSSDLNVIYNSYGEPISLIINIDDFMKIFEELEGEQFYIQEQSDNDEPYIPYNEMKINLSDVSKKQIFKNNEENF